MLLLINIIINKYYYQLIYQYYCYIRFTSLSWYPIYSPVFILCFGSLIYFTKRCTRFIECVFGSLPSHNRLRKFKIKYLIHLNNLWTPQRCSSTTLMLKQLSTFNFLFFLNAIHTNFTT